MRRGLGIAILVALMIGSAAAGLASRSQPSSILRVDYYYIPYCYSCARVLKGLHGLPEQLGPRVRLRTVDSFSDEGKRAAATYGFVTHGLVIHDSRRGLIFEEKDHGVNPDDVREVLRSELSR